MKNNTNTSFIDAILSGAALVDAIMKDLDEEFEKENMPKASPLDLLAQGDYERMDTYLNRKYKALRDYIDENYVALLMALSDYEDVDFEAKISAHIASNIRDKIAAAKARMAEVKK